MHPQPNSQTIIAINVNKILWTYKRRVEKSKNLSLKLNKDTKISACTVNQIPRGECRNFPSSSLVCSHLGYLHRAEYLLLIWRFPCFCGKYLPRLVSRQICFKQIMLRKEYMSFFIDALRINSKRLTSRKLHKFSSYKFTQIYLCLLSLVYLN